MPNSQFHTAISTPRFNRFLAACGNNRERAERLYRANLRLSQKMYAVIGLFEVVLRNSIDRHYRYLKGHDWLVDAVSEGGYLDISTGCEDSFHCVQDAIFRLNVNYTHDRLIAKLSLGFWTYQFAAKEFAAAGSNLLEILANRPKGTRQKTVFQHLIRINEIRNRIAHYEPICFEGSTTVISTAKVKRRYNLIIELLKWLGCNPEEILKDVDEVEQAIDELNKI